MLQEQDFIDAGYKKFHQTFHNNADFGLQKLIHDEKGKRYYITVFVYDWTKYPQFQHIHPFGFQPEVQFKLPSGIYLDVSQLVNNDTTVKQIEYTFAEIFEKMRCDYYDIW
jgi:hypothetical protein